MQEIIRCGDIKDDLSRLLNNLQYSGLFILTDSNTATLCLPRLESIPEIMDAKRFVIPAGDGHKNLQTLSQIWEFLSQSGATRKSLLINLGGGMLTDLGGFAAATFKRGIRFINIPTTLLGAVDAAVGGKTGINFGGLKNEIGAFCPAVAVLIDTRFFRTLDSENLLSGYAEMLKHALLSGSEALDGALSFDFDGINCDRLTSLLFDSVAVKENIVRQDPSEQGLRKALNLGHTFGHAFESLSHEQHQPVLHGYAVVYGMVCELYLSHIKLGLDRAVFLRVTRYIKENYGTFSIECNRYERLFELMQRDKKNETNTINFTLLRTPGNALINQTATKGEIEEALDYFREIN
ncbi:MAG: 3-dehydroquinate synthase [Dysgonamonadaceae bacterium]|jgi:3-dehydroquinate synthase|nr:3-dehydroquinate synthase [Dysgonamonadaceae bacterium]